MGNPDLVLVLFERTSALRRVRRGFQPLPVGLTWLLTPMQRNKIGSSRY
ncbi:MAG: hypothetical protein HC941_23930 [Microcoleus sp. SU_5_3]|nr:hypothetical protein [Microcoleus sp. SU_5_3]